MAKSIPGGVEIVNTLSTKNDGNYPLVKAESVGMADGTTAEDNIKKKLDKNQGTQNNGKFMRVGADGNLVPDDVPIPDVSGQIKEHNENTDSHQDIRTELKKKANSGTTLSDYGITDAVPDSHLTDSKAHEDIRKETAKLKEDITTQMEAKLDKQQGVENAGKVLVIGSDGNIVPGEVQGGSSEKQMELIESYAIEQSDTGFEIPIGSEYKDVLVEIKIKPREVAALRMKFDSQEVMFVTTGSYLGGSTLLQLFMHNYGGYADGWLKKISYETQISTNSFNSMKIKGMPNTITLTPWKSPSVIGVEAATAYVYAR